MWKRLHLQLLLLLLVQLAIAQTTRYEYWTDNNYDSRTIATTMQTSVPLELDVSTVKPGLHYFNFRAQDTASGQWGGLSRYMFFLKDNETGTARYEYWLDNDYDKRTLVSGTPSSVPIAIDLNTVKPGLHYFNFRTQGKSGQWGGLSRYLFFMKQDAIGQLANIDYWIDERKDVMTQQVTDSTVVITMDITNLSVGNHTFNIEGRTSGGYSGLLASYEFVYSDLPVVPDPVISHEDNMITITADSTQIDSEDVNPTYYYTIDGTTPDSTSTKYEAPFEVVRNCVVKAIGIQKGFADSKVDSLVIDWFKVETIQFEQNGEFLTMTSPTEGATIFYSMRYTEYGVTQKPTEPLPNGYVLHMPYSCTVDAYAMKDGWENSDTVRFVYQEPEADYAFDGLTLWVTGEGKVYPILQKLNASAADSIAAIVWEVNAPLTNDMLQGISNPNLLVYVNEASQAPSNVQNVVVGDFAKSIVLTDVAEGNNNFYCPQAFKAETIRYTREFKQKTQVGVSRGWETIALPFTVQSITHADKGAIAPFGVDTGNKHFWLRRLGDNGLVRAQKIEANVPYIISMPNSDEYTADYNLSGKVTFSAQNAVVPVTEAVVTTYGDAGIEMVPALQRVDRSSDVWALNVGVTRDKYFEGSTFERDYRMVRPFEAYTVHHGNAAGPAPRFVPIADMNGEATGIDSLTPNPSPKGEGSYYSLDGRRLQQKPTQKGVYLHDGRKVIIR